jgi:hypothetical protein
MYVIRNLKITLLWITWFIILTGPAAYSCTAFMMTDGEVVLVGNNEDYKVPYTRVWFVPPEKERYGRVYFGFDDWSPQGGMNDQGLFFDFFSVKKAEVKGSVGKPKFPGPMIDTMMAKYATVENVIDVFSKYNLGWMSKAQMFIVDKSGDSAIIEGDAVVRNCNAHQVVTNFRQSMIPEKNKPCKWPAYSCSRYKKAEKLLLETDIPSVPHFKDVLKATHRSSNNVIATTQYSNIYDLTEGLVYLYYLHDFDNEIVFNLKKELKKGSHYFDLPSLFGKELNYDNKVYTHDSPAFSVSYPKHYKITKPALHEVFLVKNSMGNTPSISVYVENQPMNIQLEEIGKQYLFKLIEKYSTKAKLVYSTQTTLKDGSPANETLFDRVINEYWPFKTLVLSTYRDDKLIYVATTSFTHPEALKEYLYSLHFH